MVGLLGDAGALLPEPLRHLVDLTGFAVWNRYQPAEALDAHLDREAVVEDVRRLVEHVTTLLPPAPLPVA